MFLNSSFFFFTFSSFAICALYMYPNFSNLAIAYPHRDNILSLPLGAYKSAVCWLFVFILSAIFFRVQIWFSYLFHQIVVIFSQSTRSVSLIQ